MKRLNLFFASALVCGATLIGCDGPQGEAYTIVYEANAEGQVVDGSLDELLDLVNSGNPLRVGWTIKGALPDPKGGAPTPVEFNHWADANFITILNGHVFSQVKPIFQQGPSFDTPPAVFLTSDLPNSWISIIGTTGVMQQKFIYDEKSREAMLAFYESEEEFENQMKEMETLKVATRWAVLK